MNGRMYDPVVARFLSPDPYIQAPDNTQGYNRYRYCFNNPLKYTDPDGEIVWFIPVIVGTVAGIANVAANWNNIDGFWQGTSTFLVGAGAGVAACFTGGLSFWAGAGIVAGSSAIVGANNDIVRQTGKNFDGFDQIRWGEVGKSATASGVAGFASFGMGSAAVQGPLINGIKSPLIKSAIATPASSAAGHIGGGTTYNLLSG